MPTAAQINALLPQTQCRECGFSGCLPYAQALADSQAPINLCAPGGAIVIHDLAQLLRQPAVGRAGGPAPAAPAARAPAVPGARAPATPAPTTGASTKGGAGGRPAADGAEPRNRTSRTRSRSHRADAVDDDVLLDGSIVVGRPKSRAGAHWAGVLVSVVALPVAWFFLHDGAAMATVRSPDSYAFDLSARGLTELAVGALALVIAMWVARLTSVGSITVGVISMLLGLPFLVAPGVMTDAFSPFLGDLSTQSALGQSLSTYLWTDAVTGKFLVLGVFMAMLGVVSHSARRAGRHEQEVIERGHRAED